MSLVSKLKDTLTQWRSADPYHYECTICGRSFGTQRPTCPDCGGDVERVAGELDVRGDPHP